MQPFVTDMDARRLRSLLDMPIARRTPIAARLLERKLNRAHIVPATMVPRTVVTMNARVRCGGVRTGEDLELTLVYPWAGSPPSGRLSILTPGGIALLGAVPGDAVVLEDRVWKVADLAFQPEAERIFYL